MVLVDAAATNGQLGVGRFRVRKDEGPPCHKHLHEDEVFMLIKGTALLWCDDEEMELSEGGILFLSRNVPHCCRITSNEANLLMMCTLGGFEGMFQQAGKASVAGWLMIVAPAAQAITIPVACSENALVVAVNLANSTSHLGHSRVGGGLYVWHDH